MNKFSNLFLYAGLLAILFSNTQIASADTTLTSGEVQLSVAGILLDVEGSSGTLDQVSFNGSSFDIIVNSGQAVTFSSADRRQLSYSPSSASSYITRSCTSVKSSLAVNGSGLSGPLTITITPESSLCTSAGSDGGGRIFAPGEGGGFANYNFGPTADILIPLPEIIPAPTLPVPPIKITAPKLPPSEVRPAQVVTPTKSYEPEAPIYIPPQPELPQPELPSVPASVITPMTFRDFILLYWQWIVVALTGLALLGIALFIALRE